MIRNILWVLLFFLLINLFFLGLGGGIGFLLHWLLPAVDLGVGILIGVIVIGFSTFGFMRLGNLPTGESADLDDEPLPDLGPLIYPLAPIRPRRRRRKL